jgi:hypothetical protein
MAFIGLEIVILRFFWQVATIKKVILVLIKLQKMVNIVFPVSIRRKGSAFTRKLTNATVEATQKTAKKVSVFLL